MHNVFNHLLAALCIADMIFIGGNLALTPIALGKPELFNPGKYTQIPENTKRHPNTNLMLTSLALGMPEVFNPNAEFSSNMPNSSMYRINPQ